MCRREAPPTDLARFDGHRALSIGPCTSVEGFEAPASLAELQHLVEIVRAGATSVLLDPDHSLPVFLTGHFWETDPAPDAFTRLGERAFDHGILSGAVEVLDAVHPYMDIA